jgi:hypothetical protein
MPSLLSSAQSRIFGSRRSARPTVPMPSRPLTRLLQPRKVTTMSIRDDAPQELVVAVTEFWPDAEVDNALGIAQLESGWDAFALLDTASKYGGCGIVIGTLQGQTITAERSVGYFQINACSFPGWEWQRLYNARHNAGTAHMLWSTRGWAPWFFSAKTLGLT